MKKEYIILIVIIAALCVYLFSRNKDLSNYDLPQIEKIKKSEITKIELMTKDLNLLFLKEDDKWFINKEKYLADMSSVNSMLDTIAKLKVSALVAQKADLKRYELDDEKRIKVIARSNSGILRDFNIGKAAPTFNHTFISFKDNKDVYHGTQSFRNLFDKSLDDFRDKTIFSFNKEEIKRLKLVKDNKQIELVLEKIGKKDADSENKASEPAILWKATDGSEFDQDFVNSIVSNLTNLKCDSFLDIKEKETLEGQKFLFKILINNKNSLIIFDKKESYPSISSDTIYPFLLSLQKGENFMTDIDKILGIEKPEEKKETTE